MKLRFLYVLLGLVVPAGVLSAQVTEHSRDYEAFSGVEVSGGFTVEVVEGPAYSLSIAVDDMLHNFIQVDVEDGVLKVLLDEKTLTPEVRRHYRSRLTETPDFKATVTAPSALRSFSLKGKAVLGRIEGKVFAPDSAKFYLADDSRIENVTMSGSGAVSLRMEKRSHAVIRVEGGSFSAELSGSSSLNLESACEEVSLSLSANSSCVTGGSSGVLSLSAKGTSRSILNGSAEEVRYTLSGSTDVNAENLQAVDARVNMSGFCTLTQSARGSVFLELSNGSKLTYKNSPVFYINSVRNSTVQRYYETEGNDSSGRTL